MANYVGTIKGGFSVDSNGGALYSIPIQVPPGTAGLMPQLAVAYNSGSGNDLLGVGWSLQGVSVITRSAATMAQDGFIGVVGYDAGDRFSIDGQRLVPVTGNYGDQSAIYHTEIESWKKVVPVYNNNESARSGPDSFLIYNKDGKLMEYGTSPDAQIEASPENASIRVWALNKITDLNGNYMTITYQVDTANGYFYPSRIDYTGNNTTGLSPQRCVQFIYENRPDTVPHYLGGYKVEMVQRLARIETLLDNQLVMSYTFAYQQGQATGRSQMVSVTQADSNGVALPPTTFEWQDGDPAIFAAAQSMHSPSTDWGGTLLPMDVNGNGLIDIVNAYSSNGYLQMDLLPAKPDGSGFGEKVNLPATGLLYGGMLLPMDVNGDGCIDLVYAVDNGGYLGVTVMTAAEVDGQWTLQAGPINGAVSERLLWGGSLLAMDVDGDGLTDLVYITDNGGKLGLKILFSNGTSFARSDEDQTVSTVLYGGQCFSTDFNGDGMADLIYAYDNNKSLGLSLFLSNGRRGLIQQTTSPLPQSTKLQFGGSLLSIDLNGDGRDDLVYAYANNNTLQLCTLISNGVSLEPQPVQNTGIPYYLSSATPPVILPMEVNGDGLPDLVIAENQDDKIRLNVMLSTGTGFNLQTQARQSLSSYNWGGSLLPLDLNGHGKTDILYATQNSTQTAFSRALASGAYPDLITTITTVRLNIFERAVTV
jgi:virulence plasmid B protein/VCBS repeat protein